MHLSTTFFSFILLLSISLATVASQYPTDFSQGAMITLEDGTTVMAGSCTPLSANGRGIALVQMDTTGTIICSSCDEPVVTGSNDMITTLTLQSDGKIIAGGASIQGLITTFLIARYDSNCTLDATFGVDGITTVTFPNGPYASVFKINILSNGRLHVIGSSGDDQRHSIYAVATVNPDGTLRNRYLYETVLEQTDVTFVVGGSNITPTGSGLSIGVLGIDTLPLATSSQTQLTPTSTDTINGLILQPNGQIVAVGNSIQGSNSSFVIARYNANCSLDTTFGINGITTVDFAGAPYAVAYAAFVKNDGGIIVVGSAGSDATDGNYAVAVLDGDGILDTTFASGAGMQIYSGLVGNSSSQARTVMAQSINSTDDVIIFAGYGMQNGIQQFQIARITNPTGVLDTTFAGSGILPITFNGASLGEIALCSASYDDNRMVIFGNSQFASDNTYIVSTRLFSDGSPDYSYNGTSRALFAQEGVLFNSDAACITPSEKIHVSGNANAKLFVLVYLNTGTFDSVIWT